MKRISALVNWLISSSLLILLILSSGCLKKNQQPCEASATGTVEFINHTADTCTLTFNNTLQGTVQLPPNGQWYINNVANGNYTYEFSQVTSAANPNQWNGTLTVTDCDTSIAKAP